MKQTLEFVKKVAVQTGRFQLTKLGRIRSISYKGRMNLVTDVDKSSEEIILKRLKKRFPDYLILSEESGGAYKNSPSPKWVIDPLDGTTNYAHGFPFFCVSIALEKEGTIVLGVVYDPIRDELFSATRGSGAFCNNKRIRVSSIKPLKKSLLATGFPYKFGKGMHRNIVNFKNFMMSAQAVRRAGSAALDLCYVATGRFEGFWEMDLHPWDTPAGAVIVEEAGGRISDFSGGPFNHYKKEIIASNSKIHSTMIKVLSKT